MAARFVVGLALIALCHSSPAHINGEDIRDGRSLTLANGNARGYGANTASAKVYGQAAQASSTNNGAGFDQGQANADTRYYENAAQAPIDIARAQGYYQPQGYYHPYPAAQPAIITYNQNLVPAEQLATSYQPLAVAPASAESFAIANDNSESSLSTASNIGSGGVSQSDAETIGKYGKTNTNAKVSGEYNTAKSDAVSGFNVASVHSTASGLGSGLASSNAHTTNNGLVAVAPIAPEAVILPSVIAAKNQGFYNPTLHRGSASSNANVVGYGSADSSAKVGPARRSISWRFGTAYDIPAGYGAIKSTPTVYQPAPVVYQPAPIVYNAVPAAVSPLGAANSYAKTQGAGSAQSGAKQYEGSGSTRSTANSANDGSAQADANLNNGQYSLYRSSAFGSGAAKTSANTNGYGTADANTYQNNGGSIAKSIANSNGGSAKSTADITNQRSGLYRASGAELPSWSRTISDAQTVGTGNAAANAQANHGWKSADSSVRSTGSGNSFAHSHSL